MASKKGSYTPMPTVPDDLQERYRVTLAVLSGMITLSEGARRLGLSRVQYQTIMHRGLHGLVDGLSPKLPGRPPKSEQEQRLHDENEKLRRENEKLRSQAETVERMLGVASELVRGRLTANARQPRKKKTTTSGGGDDEDPRQQVLQLRSLRMRAPLVAALAGVSTATVRRWKATPCDPAPVATRTPAPEASAVLRVEQMVRELRGLIGAESLSHAVPGVSRRQAANIKHRAMTEMERERRASVVRITVTAVGVVRGASTRCTYRRLGSRTCCSAQATRECPTERPRTSPNALRPAPLAPAPPRGTRRPTQPAGVADPTAKAHRTPRCVSCR